jgi:type 1 glutamine amidotransferase
MVSLTQFRLPPAPRYDITETNEFITMRTMKFLAALAMLLSLAPFHRSYASDWVVYQGKEGPGQGKHIVFVTGDEEYRSEECMPMLAKILAERHGFKCTVLFALNPTNGTIDPLNQTNIVGLKHLEAADMMVVFARFRELSDDQMKFFVDFVNSGKPILGLRTATHAFTYERNKQSPYAKYDRSHKGWPGGFGQQVLGETWVNHHGVHLKESTRGVINDALKNHPILKGVADIWGPSDVYTVTHLPPDAQVLVHGQVLEGMKPTDQPLAGPKNNPMMPLIWTRNYTGEAGKTSRILCSTMGSGVDLENEGLRRLLVNACYWGLGLEAKIPARSNVDYVGDYKPSFFGFGKFRKGVKPADLE